jgi:predicted DNA-binding transcriptional regulator YafY
VYRIENQEDIERGGVRSWLLNTFAVNNLINESHHLKRRILFEQIPSGQRFLTGIIEAMRDEVTIMMTHQNFWAKNPHTFELEPWCVKVFHQRWYVLGRSVSNGQIRIYGLDRIKWIEATENKFKLPKNFDAENYFNDVIGIIIGGDEKVEKVQILVTNEQQKYFRSLPLHHSQEEQVVDEWDSIFTFYLKPTIDFRQELLKYGDAVEVLKPEWLRQYMKEIANKMYVNYKSKNYE